MTINLNIDGKEKKFSTVKLKGIAYLKVIKATQKLKKMNDFDKKEFYFLSELISECFNKQFTKEQFINSVDLEDIIPIYIELIEECKKQVLSKANI